MDKKDKREIIVNEEELFEEKIYYKYKRLGEELGQRLRYEGYSTPFNEFKKFDKKKTKKLIKEAKELFENIDYINFFVKECSNLLTYLITLHIPSNEKENYQKGFIKGFVEGVSGKEYSIGVGGNIMVRDENIVDEVNDEIDQFETDLGYIPILPYKDLPNIERIFKNFSKYLGVEVRIFMENLKRDKS